MPYSKLTFKRCDPNKKIIIGNNTYFKYTEESELWIIYVSRTPTKIPGNIVYKYSYYIDNKYRASDIISSDNLLRHFNSRIDSKYKLEVARVPKFNKRKVIIKGWTI